jgi:hypothetical protein
MDKAYAKYLKDVAQAVTVAFLSWTLGTLLMWGYVSFKKQELCPIPESVVSMIGIGTTGTLVNRFLQIKEKAKTDEETPS